MVGALSPTVSGGKGPVIVIATANVEEGARHLRSLSSELTEIAAALAEGQQAGICEIVTLPNATPEQVVRTFQDDDYRDRIAVFHFAGHAGPEGLLLETATGSTAVADAGGLAEFLGCQRGLQLVVLNACATLTHVDALRDAGVGAVIATSRSVEDAIAHEFAVQFYQGLGSGAGIKRAYDEAAAGVRFKRGATARGSTAESMHASAAAVSATPVADEPVTRSIVRKNAATTEDGRWPWDIYFRRGAEEAVAPWALPEAAGNPLFGLPTLPEGDKPIETPFRHLRPFSREHAEVFFGRGKDIRELFDKVTGAASEPVTLLFGATGVGKSSLLDAGLLPRLTGLYEVRYAPRDRALGLLGTLAHALGDPAVTVDATTVSTAWRALEQSCGRPLFVVIDQLEEAYTSEDSGRVALGAAARELDAFAAAIASLFANDATRPKGRLVLGFRKEWLSEVKGALEAHRVPRSEHRLDQLTRGGLLEAVTGPTRVPQRRMPTRLEIEPGLEVLIADDLIANRASHVAPLLQILLAEMWTEAPRRDGVVRFDPALYSSVQAKAKQLDGFVTQQIEALRAWHAPFVESGLVLEFLRFYTTPKGTSDEHAASEESTRYPHANDIAPGLRTMCARLFLVVVRDADDAGAPIADPAARLAHDTLAPIIRDRFDRSDLPGPRAKRVLDGRSPEWKDAHIGTPLDSPDLRIVETGETGMRVWNDEERALVAASRVERDRARRRRAWVIRGAIAAVTLIAAFGVGSWLLYGQSQARLADSTSREWGARALSTDPPLRDVALLYGVASYDEAQTFEARRALFTQLGQNASLIRVASVDGTDIVFAPDGKRALLKEAHGIATFDFSTGVESPERKFPAEVNLETITLDPSGTTYSAAAADSTPDVALLGVWDIETARRLGQLRVRKWSEQELRQNRRRADSAAAASVSDHFSFGDVGPPRPAPIGSPAGRNAIPGIATPGAPDWPSSLVWQVGPPLKDGHHVVATAEGYDVILWDLESATQRTRLKGHTDRPSRVLFSADGSVVVTAADDSRIIMWDVATGKRLKTARGTNTFGTLGIAISRDNSTLAVDAALSGDTLSFWSLRDNKPPRQLPGGNFTRMSFTEHDALLIAAGGDGEVQVFTDPLNRRGTPEDSVSVYALHGAQDVVALVASAAGSRVAMLSAEGTVHVWDLADSTLMRRAAIPIDTTPRMTGLTTDGRLAIVQHEFGGTISVWDITVSPPVQRFSYDRIARRRLTGTEFDIGASGRLLVERTHASGNAPRYVFFGGNDSLPTSIPAPSRAEMAVDASTARVAYALPGTRAVVIANLETGKFDTLDAGRDASGRRFADSTLAPPVMFSPRGDLLVTQASQFAVLVWDLATRRVRDSLSDFASYSVLRVSEDGSIMAAVDPLQVQFWRRGTHEAMSRFRWKSGIPSTAFALSPDGSMFAADVAGLVTLIDVARGDVLGEIETDQGAAEAVTFVDGGRALLAVNPAGQIARIVTDPEAWADRACAIASSRNSLERWVAIAPAGSRAPRHCGAPTSDGVRQDTTP